MRRIISTLLLLAVAATFAECRRNKVIPDDTLADIFHDSFLANSYVGVSRIDLDSLQIYEPIFEKYGYTSKDVRYTVGNFSRRKSARLGNVVERAISRLDEEGKVLEQQVVILDTISNVAVRTMRRTILADSLREIRKAADSTRLRIEIEPVAVGEYNVSYEYEYGEDISKYPRRSSMWFERENGSRRSSYSYRLRKEDKIHRVMNADDESSRLVIDLGSYEGKARNKKQNLTIRNLRIRFTPAPEAAVDSLFARYVDIKIFADEFLRTATDSLALPADSTRVL